MSGKIKWIWSYYRRYPYLVIVLLIMTPIQAFFVVSIPRLIEFMVDFIKTGLVPANAAARWLAGLGQSLGLSTAATFSLALACLGLIAGLLYAFVQSHRAWMNFRLEWMFRQTTFNNLVAKGPNFYNRFRTGDIITRLTDDIEQKLAWFACSGIFRFYEALVAVIFTLVMMITIDPLLTLISAGPLPILVLIFFKSANHLLRRYDNLQRRISNFNDVIEACFTGIRVVRAYVKEHMQQRKFMDAAQTRRQAEIDAVKASTIVDSLYMYIWQFGVVLVLLAGGYMVIQANLSLGKLVAFIYYEVHLVFPMFDIGQFLVRSRQSAVSIDRLTEMTSVPAMVGDNGDGRSADRIAGRVDFENVSFQFPEQGGKIVDGISLSIEPKKKVAIVGKVGAGKSWLVSMIPRLVDPTEGRVKIDGHDVREYNLESLRRRIGCVMQEPALFSDTVRNNILFGRAEISSKTLEWAVDVSQLKSEVAAFPNGLDTYIGTHGVAISGGQKQRLALARALAGKPQILILDDCTSALDASTEALLWNSLQEALPGMTMILVTHRTDTLERADKIYVLDHGRLAETGTHAELIEKGGLYARMYRRYKLAEQVA